MVTLVVHAVLIVAAISFVAVKVILKDEVDFESKPVARPKMNRRKLQVPVNTKQAPPPKLRKQIVVTPKLNKQPDIRMPEIVGVKGGIGAAGGGGFGGGSSLGFAIPEIEIFGVKGKGEKILFALDAGAEMMHDEMGGIAAYTIIKNELIRIVDELPPTTLFNVIVFDWGADVMAFPQMVPASDANAEKMAEWLKPLNAVKKGMGDRDYGIHTLANGGVRSTEELVAGKFEDIRKVGGVGEIDVRRWYRSAMLAQKMQADTIFILSREWDLQRVPTSGAGMTREQWDQTAAGKKWNAAYKAALKTLDEENRQRKAAGQPPKIIARNEWAMAKDYYPDIERPPSPDWYNYTPKDFVEAFLLLRDQYAVDSKMTRNQLNKNRKQEFAFNVIQFVPQGESADEKSKENFKVLTGLCNGQYQTIAGLDAIQSYVK